MGARDPNRFLPAFAVLAMAWLALFPITSVDAYYHLAVGKRILDDRVIPARGVGSATFGSAAWHDNEWGFQLLAAAVGRGERGADGVVDLTPGGRVALIALRAACLAATLGFLSAAMRRRGVPALGRAVAVVLAAFLTFGNLFWDVRPQIVSYLAFAAIAWLLEVDRDGARWAAPAVCGVVAVWSNLHGMFLIGIALVGAEMLGEAWDGRRAGPFPSRARRLAVTAAGALLAACVNPHGWRQLTHPFLYLVRPEIHVANPEWSRPDLLHLPLMVGTMALTLAAWVAAGASAWRTAAGLRVLLFVALFSTAIRHLPVAVLVVVPHLAEGIAAAERRRPRLGRGRPAWGAAGLAVAAIVALSGARFVGPMPRFTESPARPMPERAVRFAAAAGIEGAVFNEYRFGGFLMYRLYPREVVFMDGRNDLYGAWRLTDYVPILAALPGWEGRWREAVARYRVGWALLDATTPLATALQSAPGWIRVAPDGSGVTDGVAGQDGIVCFLADTPRHREAVEAAGWVVVGEADGTERMRR